MMQKKEAPKEDLILLGDISIIYDTYVSSIMNAEQRRSQISGIYTAILAATVAGLGFKSNVDLLFPAMSALFLSTLWASQIRYFQTLSNIKWKTVLDLERRLIAAPFTEEYAAIKRARVTQKHSKKRFSELEIFLPQAVQAVSAVYLLFKLFVSISTGKWRFWEALI